jgi:hypothetical protein
VPAGDVAGEAAELLTHFGRRYPDPIVAVILVALVVGLLWYWQQQRRLNEQADN